MDITRLQEAFDFTVDDLEANRNDLLSERQRETALPSLRRFLVGTTAGLALFFGVAVIYAWIDVNFRSAAFLGILSVWVVWEYWRKQYKLYKQGVEEIALMDMGEVKRLNSFKKADVVMSQEGDYTLKAIPVGDIKLYLTDEAYAVLEEGVSYCLYYWRWLDKENMPDAETLSIELIDKNG